MNLKDIKKDFMARYEGANTAQSTISSRMAKDIWCWFEPILLLLSETKPSTASSEKKKYCESDGMVYLSYPAQYKCKNCGKYWFNNEPTPVCMTVTSTKFDGYSYVNPIPPKKKIEKLDIRENRWIVVDKINQLIDRVNSLENK